MHMYMKNRLSSSLVYIYTDIVTVRMETLVNFLFYILKHDIHCFTFMVSKIKI